MDAETEANPYSRAIDKAATRFGEQRPRGPVQMLIARGDTGGDALPAAYREFSEAPFRRSIVATTKAGEAVIFDVWLVAEEVDAARLFGEAAAFAGDNLSEPLRAAGLPAAGFTNLAPWWRWVIAMADAAGRQLLGTDGFKDPPARYSPDLGLCVSYATIQRAAREDVSAILRGIARVKFEPATFMVFSNAAASSVALCDHLADAGALPPPPAARGDTTDDRLRRLYAEDSQAVLVGLTQKEVARKIGRSEAAVSDSSFWREHIKPKREQIAGAKTRRKHLEAKRASGRITATEAEEFESLDQAFGRYADDIDREA